MYGHTVNLDINQIRAFLVVAHVRSFSKAALQLCRVQSAVSQQIQRLERQLAVSLFIRDRKGLKITPEGERLMPYALKLVSVNDQAVRDLGPYSFSHVLKVGTSDAYAETFFADILQQCALGCPQLEIQLQCGYGPEIWQAFNSGDLDLVLTQSCPAHINAELLHTEPLVWVCACDSRVYKRRPVPLALFTEGCADRQMATWALSQAGIPFKVGYQATHHSGVLAALGSGGYVSAIVPSNMSDSLRLLDESDGFPALGQVEISLGYRELKPGTASAHFVDIAKHYFQAAIPTAGITMLTHPIRPS
jgi:DNA-binding transcriptional LysR family regulator